MPFESLSSRYTFPIEGIPERWLPLIYLYDPDLPLFPIYYFHILSPDLRPGDRPSEIHRIFGYIEKINFLSDDRAEITIITNKNLNDHQDPRIIQAVQKEVKERLGIINPVTRSDIETTFSGPLERSNPVLIELWHRVVSYAYGDKLPFGRLWDEVFGLVRFVSSWNPPAGRKSELIQTHYFMSKFGVRIQSSANIPSNDFFLLPTIQELTDTRDMLSSFPAFSRLVEIAGDFHRHYCDEITIGGLRLSKFKNPARGKFNTSKLMDIFNSPHFSFQNRPFALDCFNAFDKGPGRTVLFLMMLDDIRFRRLDPKILSKEQCGSIYDSLKRARSYQSPKVIQIYSQQSFGNTAAMPIDTWIDTFFKWPLVVYDTGRSANKFGQIFSKSQNLGKTERLLWVTAQARKVHSSACDDAVWCIKKSKTADEPRGANPLACNICRNSVRHACPAFQKIKDLKICFNSEPQPGVTFRMTTNRGDNTTPNQKFESCTGKSIYKIIKDDSSPGDNPNGFAPFPAENHDGSVISVDDFVRIY